MELIKYLFDFIMHIDIHLVEIIKNYGIWTYLILFFIIFGETGFVVTPFLPGDSMLFVVGALAAKGSFNLPGITITLILAAVLGNTINYYIGRFFGPKIFSKDHVRFLNKEYLMRTHAFYEKHGGKAIIITRFAPILRTFAPFVAGIGAMNQLKFNIYNIIGGVSWVGAFIFAGYFFGNIPTVKHNFTIVIFAIIIISLMPSVISFLNHKFKK